MKNCIQVENSDLYYYFSNSNIIYPWEINEYSKIGINNFKLVGRNMPEFRTGKYIDYYEKYLNGVDNIKNIENLPIRYFNNYIYNNQNIIYTVKEIKPYLPNIEHFKKYGHLCASQCGSECNYCKKCADKMQNALEI